MDIFISVIKCLLDRNKVKHANLICAPNKITYACERERKREFHGSSRCFVSHVNDAGLIYPMASRKVIISAVRRNNIIIARDYPRCLEPYQYPRPVCYTFPAFPFGREGGVSIGRERTHVGNRLVGVSFLHSRRVGPSPREEALDARLDGSLCPLFNRLYAHKDRDRSGRGALFLRVQRVVRRRKRERERERARRMRKRKENPR